MDDTPAMRLVRELAKPRGSHRTRDIEYLVCALDQLTGEVCDQQLITGVDWFVRTVCTCEREGKLLFINEAFAGIRDLKRAIEGRGERVPLIVRAIDNAARLCNALSKCGQWRDWNTAGELPGSDEDRQRIVACVRSAANVERYFATDERYREEYLRYGEDAVAVLEELRRGAKQKQTERAQKQRRRSRAEASPRPLTPKQVEVMQVFGECKGNLAEVARRLSRDRATVKEHYQAATKKMGAQATRPKTERLRSDLRGQLDVTVSDDRRKE
ncbi:MAG: response regulator transcription factor [Planctomycetaceae bacterium]|nr:response regulator transcription factor [Planctomycetaceae bacterium]